MTDRVIAYFSLAIAFDPGMPTCSGGLGVLAGDTIRCAADCKLQMVAVTLLHRARELGVGWRTHAAKKHGDVARAMPRCTGGA